MKKKQKEPTWTMQQIVAAWSRCHHIHLGSPKENFVEWDDMRRSLEAQKTGQKFKSSPIVHELAHMFEYTE